MAFEAPLSYARRNGAITKRIGRLVMRVSGWRFEGELPDVPKVLISVAPHTSNWDFIVGISARFALRLVREANRNYGMKRHFLPERFCGTADRSHSCQGERDPR